MAVIYSSASLVRARVKNIDPTLTDANIEQYIAEAEGIIDSTMKVSLKNVFDPVKHSLVRSCATDLAAYYCLSFNPSTFSSLTEVELIMNMLWNSAERSLAGLSDPRVVSYLSSL